MITRSTDIRHNRWITYYLQVITDIFVIIGIFLVLSGIFLSALSLSIFGNQGEVLSKAGHAIKIKHPNWSDEACNAVSEHKVYAGMSEEQVAESWGWPYMVNTIHADKRAERKEWVMTNKVGSDKLYFYNGYLEKGPN